MSFKTVSIVILALASLAGWVYVIWDTVHLIKWRKSLKAKPNKEDSSEKV